MTSQHDSSTIPTSTTINQHTHFQILEINENDGRKSSQEVKYLYRHYTNGDKSQEVREVLRQTSSKTFSEKKNSRQSEDGMSDTSSVVSSSSKHHEAFSIQDTLQVPQDAVGRIIGKKGSIRSRLERQYHVHLRIPGRNETKKGEDVVIRISAADQRSIYNVKKKILRIVEGASSDQDSERSSNPRQSKRTPPPTHFLSLPLNDDSTQQYFETLKTRVHRELGESSSEYSLDLYQTPIRLHITLQVLHLMTPDDVQTANDIFSQANLKDYGFYDNEHEPHIRFGSLGAFSRKSLDKSYVVYLEVEDSPFKDSILRMATDLKEKFMRAELIQDTQELKLHVTFMNVKFSSKKNLFDAKPIMDAYEKVRSEMEFESRIPLTRLDLSKMKSKSKQHYYDYEQQKFF